MSVSSLRRTLIVLLLGSFLGAPWAAAVERRPAPTPRGQAASSAAKPSVPARLWGFLVSLWSDEGCGLDPSGSCKGSLIPTQIHSDAGCGIDPDGSCKGGH